MIDPERAAEWLQEDLEALLAGLRAFVAELRERSVVAESENIVRSVTWGAAADEIEERFLKE